MTGRKPMRWAERLARWMLRCHPRAFRTRYGPEVEAALARASREGARGTRLVGDAVGTLVRSWRDRLLEERGDARWTGGGEWAREVRFAVRGLARDPTYGLVAVLTLALAIGGNAAVFSVGYSVLLRSLPYEAPERTVNVSPPPVRFAALGSFAVSGSFLETPQVESAAAFTPSGAANLELAGGAEPLRVTHVDGRFFDVLGARLRLGRGVSDGGDGPEAVLSHGLWVRSFGADPAVIGRTIRLSGHPVTVTGVAAAEVDYPADSDLWLSYPLLPGLMGAAAGAEVIARIAPSASIGAVRDRYTTRFREEWEAAAGRSLPDNYRAEFRLLRSSLVGPVEDALLLLFAGSAVVLLLGCVNLGGLSSARYAARAGEIAMRSAMGAGRFRITRMIVTESMVVAGFAGIVALAFVVSGRALLIRLLPAGLPGLDAGGPGLETLAFVMLLAVLTGVAVGLIPSVQLWRTGPNRLPAAGRLSERRRRLHPMLVVAQVALAVVLAVSAGLLGRSVLSLRTVPLGYDTDRVLTFETRLPVAQGSDTAFFRRFADEVRASLLSQPAVRGVGVGSWLPLSEGLGVGFAVSPLDRPEDEVSATSIDVSSSYFDALGIRLLAGSGLAPGARAAGTVVVSRSLAEHLGGSVDVVGRQLRVRMSQAGEPDQYRIVGVVEDVRRSGFLGEPGHAIYLPLHTRPASFMAFAVKTDGDPGNISTLVRRVVHEADPTVAPFAVRTLESAASDAIATRDALALVSFVFGAVAFLLAALGIYGLVAQSVVRRRREMGIRLAVGAHAGDLLAMVLQGAGVLTLAGLAIGVLASFASNRLLAGFLFGVGTMDPITFGAVAGIAFLASAVASLGPAGRAARTDPMTSLRTE